MRKGIKIIEDLGARGYRVEGIVSGKQNTISHKQLQELINKVTIINKLEDDLKVITTDIEEFENGFDVNVSEWTIKSDDSEVNFSEKEEFFKTYKTIKGAKNYASKF